MSTAALESSVDLSRSRLDTLLKVLDVDGAVKRVKGGWTATGRDWEYDTDRYERVPRWRVGPSSRRCGTTSTTDSCRMEFLRRQLDDPGAGPCGRCDNCTGTTVRSGVESASVLAARDRLARPGVVIEAKKMWPTNMAALGIDVKGRIGAAESAEPGRAIGRLAGVGYGPRLRELVGPGAKDADVPQEIVDAAVNVLSQWKAEWPERPAAVAAVGSSRLSLLVESTARAIADIGHLQFLGVIEHVGSSSGGRTNSAQRLRAVWNDYAIPADVEAGLRDVAGRRGPVGR